ncbi:MAG: TldD/PmbA family protein [Candidatus Thorarchaeota archaeon]|jgi:PmbA protein
MEDILMNTGIDVIRYGEKIGAQEIEAYLESVSSIEISVEDSKIKNVAKKRDTGCGIRIVNDKRTGYSYATTINPSDVRKTVDASIGLAKVSSADKDFVGFLSGNLQYPTVKKIHDPSIASLQPEDAIEIMYRSIQATHDTLMNITEPKVSGMFEAKECTRVILNSNEISCSYQSTMISYYIASTIRVDSSHGSSWKEEATSSLRGIDPEMVGRTTAERTLCTLNPKKMDSGVMPVLLSPEAVSVILNGGRPGSLSAALSYSDVKKNNSYLVDKLGSEIGSHIVTIIDDAVLTAGLSSRPFDAEGYPSKKTELIEEGVLKGYLHDSYTSQQSGLENTGNARRKSYSELPKIAASNFMLKPDKGSEKDLIKEIDYGLYCRSSGDAPNPLSGDLNAVVMEGQLIADGELSHAVSNTMFSLNIIDLLKGVTRIGGNPTETSQGIFPSIVIEGAHVSSG